MKEIWYEKIKKAKFCCKRLKQAILTDMLDYALLFNEYMRIIILLKSNHSASYCLNYCPFCGKDIRAGISTE